MEPAATTAGIYCQACGYDLRGSKEGGEGGEGGRCPECGRVFSPDDPKTFRRRPLAAPWKRALGRWAKRAAIFLLGLGILLGGSWLWLYRGWRQEQAVLAQVGGVEEIDGELFHVHFPRIILGGVPGRWLCERRFPGSFVLERVSGVSLPPTATDADLLPLRKLPKLQVLVAVGPITDAGLAHLETLTTLRILDLAGTHVTDAGLVHLEKLTDLELLDLRDTGVTDGGLAHLAKLTGLKQLDLPQTTPAGAGRLKAALPGCRIHVGRLLSPKL